MRRPVVILCHGVWALRNVVYSGLAEKLRTRGVPAHLVLGRTAARSLETDGRQTADNLEWCPAPLVGAQRGKPTLEALVRASFARRYGLTSHRIFTRWHERNATPWVRSRNAVAEALAVVGSREPFFGWQLSWLDQVARRSRDRTAVRRQLADLAPGLLVSITCVVGDEVPYLFAARDLGIPTLGCILSFDNLTSRGVIPTFDYYAVWNDRMGEQVLRLYPDRNPARIFITGTPQFDFHRQPRFRWLRTDTLMRLGLGAGDRFVLYGGGTAGLAPSEPGLVRAFVKQCREHPVLRRHRIVVRLHPLDSEDRWQSLLRDRQGIVLSLPRANGVDGGTAEDQACLVSTLLHADVCVNIASTLSLDAAVLDTPVVCVGFALPSGGAEDRFCREASAKCDHFRPITQSSGVRVAKDMTQLVEETAVYVHDRSRDRAGRRQLAAAECGPLDGRSAERVAALVAAIATQEAPRGVAGPAAGW
jgi:hypothetical protein